MRICQLTPGTGSWYCGSCMRDNVLIRALRAEGHEAVMGQLYLPAKVEGEHAEYPDTVFFGGLNVYLRHKSLLFRKAPRWVGRWLDAPPLLRWLSRRSGMTHAKDLGSMTVAMLQAVRGRQAEELDRLLMWMRSVGRCDVVCLSNALLMGLVRPIREALKAPVVVFCQGEDGFVDSLVQPYRSQAWELMANQSRHADALVAVSRYYGEQMRMHLRLPEGRMHVAHNGIETADLAPPETPPAMPTLGYLARMNRAKGLDTLVDAYIELYRSGRSQNAQLCVVGAQTENDPKFVAGLQRRLQEAGCGDRAEFHPNVSREEKVRLLRGMSVLSVPAPNESFGLYLLEAMACGVPVVQPETASFPELIQATGGGLLCKPNDPSDLAAKLAELLVDGDRRSALGRAGRRAVLENFTDGHMARRVIGVLRHVVEQAGLTQPPTQPTVQSSA